MKGTLAKSQCLINVTGDVESAKFSLSGKPSNRPLTLYGDPGVQSVQCGTLEVRDESTVELAYSPRLLYVQPGCHNGP
jgi:hypothetical protein